MYICCYRCPACCSDGILLSIQNAAPVRQLVQKLQRSDARHEAGILQQAETVIQAQAIQDHQVIQRCVMQQAWHQAL
jgi:hypothetical protein